MIYFRTMKSCGGAIQSTVHDLNDETLGTCETFEEKQIGGERYLKDPFSKMFLISCFQVQPVPRLSQVSILHNHPPRRR